MKRRFVMQLRSWLSVGCEEFSGTGSDTEIVKRRLEGAGLISLGKITLQYSQDLGEGETVPEQFMFHLEPDGTVYRAEMARPTLGFRLVFQPGTPWKGEFPTPAGNLPVQVETINLQGIAREESIRIQLSYLLALSGDPQGIQNLDLQLQWE